MILTIGSDLVNKLEKLRNQLEHRQQNSEKLSGYWLTIKAHLIISSHSGGIVVGNPKTFIDFTEESISITACPIHPHTLSWVTLVKEDFDILSEVINYITARCLILDIEHSKVLNDLIDSLNQIANHWN